MRKLISNFMDMDVFYIGNDKIEVFYHQEKQTAIFNIKTKKCLGGNLSEDGREIIEEWLVDAEEELKLKKEDLENPDQKVEIQDYLN